MSCPDLLERDADELRNKSLEFMLLLVDWVLRVGEEAE